MPAEIQGWSWAGFLMNWMWAIPHKAWIVLGIGLAGEAITWFTRAGVLVLVAAGILAGIKGNEWAWQNRRWRDIHHFRNTQDAWFFWGMTIRVLLFLGRIVSVVLQTAG